MSRYETGLRGEAAAERYLLQLGMRCITRRYRACGGELDLVMADGDTLVFVEVKARPGARAGAGLLAVTPAKRRRLLAAAQHYLVTSGQTDSSCRFDVIELTADGLRYVPDAFQAG